jgi:hypothetical protein
MAIFGRENCGTRAASSLVRARARSRSACTNGRSVPPISFLFASKPDHCLPQDILKRFHSKPATSDPKQFDSKSLTVRLHTQKKKGTSASARLPVPVPARAAPCTSVLHPPTHSRHASASPGREAIRTTSANPNPDPSRAPTEIRAPAPLEYFPRLPASFFQASRHRYFRTQEPFFAFLKSGPPTRPRKRPFSTHVCVFLRPLFFSG